MIEEDWSLQRVVLRLLGLDYGYVQEEMSLQIIY